MSAVDAALGDLLGEITQVLAALLLEVEPVGGPGEAQVGVDTGHDHPASLVWISIPTSDTRTTTS